MKLTAFFLLAICLQVSAFTYSQKVTLSGKNVSLRWVFKEITIARRAYPIVYKEAHAWMDCSLLILM